MGLFGTQWIQDMMDVSCGFGSWQLSMNQGLAHMQTMSFMNSCFSPSGFGFMPYSQLNSMNYLLDPNFAAWQAMTGNNSNSTSIFGNWGGMANGYTGGAAINPWGNTLTNPTGNTGSTGNTSSKKKEDDPTNKKEAEKLQKLINDYGDFVKTYSSSGGNDRLCENLKAQAKEIIDNAESWEKAVDELKKKYNDIITNESNKKPFREFILKNSDKKKALEASGYDSLVNVNPNYKNVTDEINKELNDLSNSDKNMQSLDSANSELILGVISCSRSDFIARLMNKYTTLNNNKKETVGNNIATLINRLTDRATAVSAKLVDTTDIDNAIEVLEEYKNHPRENINGFNKAFYELYAIVRIAEVKVIESEIDAKYNTYGENLSETLGSYSDETIADLKNEFSTRRVNIDVDKIAGNISVKPIEVIEDVTGMGGTSNNGPTAEQLNKKRSNVATTMTSSGKFSQNGKYVGKANESGVTDKVKYDIYEVTLPSNEKRSYIINNNGELQEIKNGKISGTAKTFANVKKEITQLEKDASQAKLDGLKNPLTAPITIISDKQIGKTSTNWHDYSSKFESSLKTALKSLSQMNDSSYKPEEYTSAFDSLISYYKAVFESLKEINWNEIYDNRADNSNQGICDNAEIRKKYKYGNKYLSCDDKDSVAYRISKDEKDVNTYTAVTTDNTTSGSGLYVGCDYDSASKNNFYFYLDPNTVFEKFKSFLPN